MDTDLVNTNDLADDRPIAVRRKRRLSSSSVGHVVPTAHDTFLQAAHSGSNLSNRARTPVKPAKKVRFSDPGPQSSTASSSTGLTPHLRRTAFEPRVRDARDSSPPRLRPQAPRRRLSVPNLNTTLPSPSFSPQSPPSPYLSGQIQYFPLHDVLQRRASRRIRRNGLSEEMNRYEALKKLSTQQMHVIENLEGKLASVTDLPTDERYGEREDATSSQRKQVEQGSAQTPTVAAIPAESVLRDESGIFIDDTAQDFVDDQFEEAGGLRDVTPMAVTSTVTSTATSTATPTVNEMATQVSIPHPMQREMFREARLSLEYLFPGEIALGLIPEDPKPLFDVMLERLQSLKTQHLIAEDALSTTQTQESNLRTQFNAVLEQLDRTRKYSEKLSEKHASEKARADAAYARIPLMEISAKDASEKAEVLQKEVKEKERSSRKLRSSLESYRVEVGKLEDLINRQEENHKEAMTTVRAEMDEAVADLECVVAAETMGRREAEQGVTERDAKIKELQHREKELVAKVKELQHREKELVATVNEKQGVIREMESVQGTETHNREVEVGQLNVQIGALSSNFVEAVEQRTQAERARDMLMRRLEDEKNAGLRAIDALRAELANFSRNTDGIQAAYASDSQRRGAEVAEVKGLLTPVTETRFRDIKLPGRVEIKRGKGKRKQRPDSGIGILEEEIEDDEDMVDFVGR